MYTKKDGTKITWRQFFIDWKTGIANITPIQRLENESHGNFISLIGFIVCLVVLIIYRDKFFISWFAYGLVLVFVGNIYLTGLKYLGIRQQLKSFKNMDNDVSDILTKLNNAYEEKIEDNKNMKGGLK
jgi:hypothetical protein